MLMPSVFGSDIFDDFMDFSFPDVNRELYGKHAKNVMKTDVRELDNGYEISLICPASRRTRSRFSLTTVT